VSDYRSVTIDEASKATLALGKDLWEQITLSRYSPIFPEPMQQSIWDKHGLGLPSATETALKLTADSFQIQTWAPFSAEILEVTMALEILICLST
jgi:hypothetical protein